MENRLELNKRPTYELPGEVLVGQYNVRVTAKTTLPDFTPDLCLKAWGDIGKLEKEKETSNQIWIKTNNKELLDFIKQFDYKNYFKHFIVQSISINYFKKILLEEFYGDKNGE